MIKVSAGVFKGRKLQIPASARPTSDKARQALFNILGNVTGLKILDLFAGSGAIGIEALSRGAEKVIFNDLRSGKIIEQNLILLNLQSTVLKYNWQHALNQIDDFFDIIFLDPPYKFNNYHLLIKKVIAKLVPGGKIIIECDKKSILNIEGFSQKEYIYNNTKLVFLEVL